MNESIREGDVLLVEGKLDSLMESKDALKLEIAPEFKLQDETLKKEDRTLIEVMVAPSSRVAGRTLRGLDFNRRYDAVVLAIQRQGRSLREQLSSVRLKFGDLLLLQAPKGTADKLRPDADFVVMDEKGGLNIQRSKVPVVLGILALVVGLAALNILPILVSAILGCIAMLLTRCLRLEEAYQAIDWRVVFLLGGVLPLGIAMQKSGLAATVAEHAVSFVGHLGPIAVLAAFYILTALLTECMSNNASAVLLAPIAISTAIQMDISPKPLLMAIAFAASTSFATPVGYQTNMMVYSPGGYRFTDFMKVGTPLIFIFGVISVYFIPKFWPF
jgi:di/tricarboxylate transporter